MQGAVAFRRRSRTDFVFIIATGVQWIQLFSADLARDYRVQWEITDVLDSDPPWRPIDFDPNGFVLSQNSRRYTFEGAYRKRE